MSGTWEVVAQRETTQTTANGEFVNVMEVSFRTMNGTVGKVAVPLGLYTPDFVREQIEARVKSIEDVAAL